MLGLPDILRLCLETAHSTPHRAGWILSQAYNSVKEIFDTSKVKPFGASFLGKLTWEPEVMLDKRGKAVFATGKQLQASYLASKNRLSQAPLNLAFHSTPRLGCRLLGALPAMPEAITYYDMARRVRAVLPARPSIGQDD